MNPPRRPEEARTRKNATFPPDIKGKTLGRTGVMAAARLHRLRRPSSLSLQLEESECLLDGMSVGRRPSGERETNKCENAEAFKSPDAQNCLLHFI